MARFERKIERYLNPTTLKTIKNKAIPTNPVRRKLNKNATMTIFR
jgi:hypothetical protein